MATLFRTEFIELAYHAATYVFISVLRSIELAHYLAAIPMVRARRSRVLFGHIIKILILLRIRALFATLFRTEFLELVFYAATLLKSESGNLAYYLATL